MEIYYEDLRTSDDTLLHLSINKMPESCPLCSTVQEASFISAYLTRNGRVEAIFKCNKQSCNSLFITLYILETYGMSNHGRYHFSYPRNFKFIEFSTEIEEISPLFVEIYNQANHAESLNLVHVAGMGYRKSLEFLIKDYLITIKGEDADTIKKTFLGNCINNFLSDNIKEVAVRATWLGNDETHYHRVWEDKDIKDLTTLINLTVHWITYEIQTARYISEMDGRR